MAITVRMRSAYDGVTHYDIYDGSALLGCIGHRDGLARWIGDPECNVHWSVLAAVYRHLMSEYDRAKAEFGEAALAGWGIHPPTMPRCARRARQEVC